MNKLVNETSPYLLQHANNPVNWYPWNDEAFDKAINESKPIFLSIGYSTCHWCHVMERESFTDDEIAKILNKNYISIKVDREERPDIDAIYMKFCITMTGSGGWPMTIIMTPNKKPFFAGTYFPKESRFGMAGLKDVLLSAVVKWESEKDEIFKISSNLTELIMRENLSKSATSQNITDIAANQFTIMFDKKYGGFTPAPKFPTPHNILYLLYFYEANRDLKLLYIAEKTLNSMYRGGIFDHIGGGFSRYSTDEKWLIPHFEKMLYDNALLSVCYLEAYRITEKIIYKDIAEKIYSYLFEEMQGYNGGFFTAQDADIEGKEGSYYVFDYLEIIKVLGESNGKYFNNFFNITEEGNFEGKNIPNIIGNEEPPDNKIKILTNKIYKYRKDREKLLTDDKILTSLNSMTAFSLLKAYRILKNKKYHIKALETLKFIEEYLKNDKVNYFVSYRDGKSSGIAFLDDYAYLILAYLELYRADFDNKALEKAVELLEKTIKLFYDDKSEKVNLSGKNNEKMIGNQTEFYDGASPSGNSIMAYCLQSIYKLTSNERYEKLFINLSDVIYAKAKENPVNYSFYLCAVNEYYNFDRTIMLLVKDKKDLSSNILGYHDSTRILTKQTNEYKYLNDKSTYYICENHICKPPIN